LNTADATAKTSGTPVKRAQRLKTLQQVVDGLERRCAEALADCERGVSESEAILAELEVYKSSYLHAFVARAQSGINGANARDYQVFLARLSEALRQQTEAVIRARARRDAHLQDWRDAAQRGDAVGEIVKRWRTAEQRTLEWREQQESDERSLRPRDDGMQPDGA
jgi:flagellar protein FliJ